MKLAAWVSFARYMATLGFCLTTFSSALFLILKIFYVKEKVGSYRNLLIVLPVTGFLFASCEFVMDPFFHSYNKGFAFFRLTSFESFSLTFNKCVLGCYVAFYGSTISILALQFVYRYWAVFSPKNLQTFFDGPRFIFPLLYVIFSFVSWFVNAFVFNSLDAYSSEYLEKDIIESYGVIISEQPAFVLVAYDDEGNIRMRNSLGLMVMTFLLIFQYSIIIYCSIVTSLKMHQKLSSFSTNVQKVHKQFYHALILQITTPTLTLFLPVFALFFVPYLNIEISFSTGSCMSAFAFYPAIDILIMIYVTSYYNQALRDFMKTLGNFFWRTKKSTQAVYLARSATVTTRGVW